MLFKEQKTLTQRGNFKQAPDEAANGTLLVGTESIANWEQGHNDYGHDNAEIFPALLNGEKCWLFAYDWQPADGYSASGYEEDIVPFDEGVKILLGRGAFEYLFM